MPRKVTVKEDFYSDKEAVNKLVRTYSRRFAVIFVSIPFLFLFRLFLFRPHSAFYYTRVYEHWLSSYSTPFGSNMSPRSKPSSSREAQDRDKNHLDHRLILAASLEGLKSSSFCGPVAGSSTTGVDVISQWRYPLGYTPKIWSHTPWAWDAVARPGYPYVDVLTIDKRECVFNQTELDIARKFQSSSSSAMRMMAPQHMTALHERESNLHSHYSSRAMCHFYSSSSASNDNTLPMHIGTTTSREVYLGVLIRCPLPSALLPRGTNVSRSDTASIPSTDYRISLQWQDGIQQYMTSAFPVCQLVKPPMREATTESSARSSLSQYRFKFSISVCAAIEDQEQKDDNSIIAWIEYHKVLGIEHFFLYDLSIDIENEGVGTSSGAAASKSIDNSNSSVKLSKYIEKGTVTLIPWRYQGCVHKVGDPLFCEDPMLRKDKKSHRAYPVFTPPGK